MKHKVVRVGLALAMIAGALGITSANAEPPAISDEWVKVDSGVIAGTGLPSGLIMANVGRGRGRRKPCNPKTATVTPLDLEWTKYQNQSSGAIAFEWSGPGTATVSNDCANRLDLTVQVTDVPASSSAPETGDPATAWDGTASNGLFSAFATSRTFIVYYDLTRLYVRSVKTVIEIKVNATYHNFQANEPQPLPCRVTYTEVTMTPNGPVMGTAMPPQDCTS